MHFAAKEYRSHELNQLLVDLGVDRSIKDKDGNTALHIAINENERGNFDVLLKGLKYHKNFDSLIKFAEKEKKNYGFIGLLKKAGFVGKLEWVANPVKQNAKFLLLVLSDARGNGTIKVTDLNYRELRLALVYLKQRACLVMKHLNLLVLN